MTAHLSPESPFHPRQSGGGGERPLVGRQAGSLTSGPPSSPHLAYTTRRWPGCTCACGGLVSPAQMPLLLSCCSRPPVSVSSSASPPWASLPLPRPACCGHSQPPLSASPEVAGVPAEEPLGAGPRLGPGRADWSPGLEAAGEQAALEEPSAGDAGGPLRTQTPRCALAVAGSPPRLPLAGRPKERLLRGPEAMGAVDLNHGSPEMGAAVPSALHLVSSPAWPGVSLGSEVSMDVICLLKLGIAFNSLSRPETVWAAPEPNQVTRWVCHVPPFSPLHPVSCRTGGERAAVP